MSFLIFLKSAFLCRFPHLNTSPTTSPKSEAPGRMAEGFALLLDQAELIQHDDQLLTGQRIIRAGTVHDLLAQGIGQPSLEGRDRHVLDGLRNTDQLGRGSA